MFGMKSAYSWKTFHWMGRGFAGKLLERKDGRKGKMEKKRKRVNNSLQPPPTM